MAILLNFLSFTPRIKMQTFSKEVDKLEPLMSKIEAAEYIADYLHVSFKQVYDRYMHMPDFPKAVALPSPTGKKSRKRWNKADLYAWMTGNKLAA